jgi:transposase
MRRRYTKEQRTQLVDLVAVGDVTVPEAAARLGVTSSAAYNWVAESRKQRRPNVVGRVAGPTFVRLVPSGAIDATILCGLARPRSSSARASTVSSCERWWLAWARSRGDAHGLPIYVALEPVDMRLGSEGLGALVREKMRMEPRSRAPFVFVGKRGHSMKCLTWDGTGTIVVHKKLDGGRF